MIKTKNVKIIRQSLGGHADNVFDVVIGLLPDGINKIVDLGCGSFRWIKKGYTIVLVDINNKYEDVIIHDLNKDFPFKDKEFDGVVAIEVIEHLWNPKHFLKECFRIAKKWIIVTTPDINKEFVVNQWFGRNAVKYGHKIMCPIETFNSACKENNWKIETVKQSRVSIVVKMIPLELALMRKN